MGTAREHDIQFNLITMTSSSWMTFEDVFPILKLRQPLTTLGVSSQANKQLIQLLWYLAYKYDTKQNNTKTRQDTTLHNTTQKNKTWQKTPQKTKIHENTTQDMKKQDKTRHDTTRLNTTRLHHTTPHSPQHDVMWHDNYTN